jgi:two-component system, NtrC family, response regulator
MMEKPKLLIVDDDETIRTQMKWALSDDYELFLAEDRPSALQIVKDKHPALVVLDLGLPPAPHSTEEGFATLRRILLEDTAAKVLIVTGNTEKEHALKAIAQGAHDFFSKPINLEEIKITLRRALALYRLEHENRELQLRLSRESSPDIIGSSSKIEVVLSNIRKIATTDVPILITGETGTGKELVAQAIHRQSQRHSEPFIAINCAAIPETLLESELFGHEKGAFTGADTTKAGRFEMAQGGMLFLDEIGEMGLGLQVKLLRFLQEHKIERIGGRKIINLDVRVLAATNRNLKEAILSGRFREDLYFRLAVITLELPPLRERGNDIVLIATAFLNRFSQEMSRPIKRFSQATLEALTSYPWPGNVRELENKIKRAVIMADDAEIEPHHLELPTVSEPTHRTTLKEARDRLEKEIVNRALAQHNWNISQAAKELGISRQALHDIILKHGMKR